MSFPPSPPLPWMQMRFGLIPFFAHNFDKTIYKTKSILLTLFEER